MSHDKRRSQAGFTMPELISVMVMSVMFSALIVYFAFQYWRSTATLQNDMSTLVSRLTAGDIIRDAINESSGMIIQNSIADTNTHVADPAYPSGEFWLPVHAVPGTITNTDGTYTPLAYFRRPSLDASKNVILNGNIPYEDEFILYMDGIENELRIRTLANPLAPSNRAKTSCPPAFATTTCPGDRRVAEDISAVETRYFSRAGIPINYQSLTDPVTGQFIGPDFPNVEVVEFNLQLFKKSTLKGGQDTINQTVIRVALRSS